MNILIFCENYRKGGLDTFLINLMNEWPDDEVFLMINNSHDGLSELRRCLNRPENIIETELFSRHNFNRKPCSNMFLKMIDLIVRCFLLLISYPIIFFQLNKLFSKYNEMDDLLVVNGGYPGGESCNCACFSWYFSKGKLSWYNFHNNAKKYNKYLKPFQFMSDYFLSKVVRGFVSVSKNCRDSMGKRSGIDLGKLEYIYNGLAVPDISLASLNVNIFQVNKLKSIRKRIVMLGTFEERKGHEFIFSVMKQLPQYDLFVCGQGDESESRRINSLIYDIDNVYLLGYRRDSYLIIASSDLLVVPSKENESFGLTIIESMALNTPVIATRVGGMQEVINHGVDGLLVEYGNVGKFKEAINIIFEDENFRIKLIKNAKNSFDSKYKANIMAMNYKKLLDREH